MSLTFCWFAEIRRLIFCLSAAVRGRSFSGTIPCFFGIWSANVGRTAAVKQKYEFGFSCAEFSRRKRYSSWGVRYLICLSKAILAGSAKGLSQSSYGASDAVSSDVSADLSYCVGSFRWSSVISWSKWLSFPSKDL